MAKQAKDCIHVVALQAGRNALMAALESLNTKVTSTSVYETINKVAGFYEDCIEFNKNEKRDGFDCAACALEKLGETFSFEEWTREVMQEAIRNATNPFIKEM